MKQTQLAISRLGEAQISSPLHVPSSGVFVDDRVRLRVDPHIRPESASEDLSFEVAGPRERIHFEPSKVRAAIATCGGLSPGLNDVIRSLVLELRLRYGAAEVLGVRHGYRGLAADTGDALLPLAAGEVDFCLVPEVAFELAGPGGLLNLLEQRLCRRCHAVVVVAEGAGQELFHPQEGRDASGNQALGDIGALLRKEISAYFSSWDLPVNLKYIDPSYLIRAAPANPSDSLYCARLARNAVHAAMSGRTSMLVGYWHGRMTHVPFAALEGRRQINPEGELWWNVLEATGQPAQIGVRAPNPVARAIRSTRV